MSKFGKLTVIEQYIGQDSRQYADVKCTCGRKKTVRVSNLTSGATRSCGAPPCREVASTAVRDASYTPRGTHSTDVRKVRKLWDLHLDTKRGLGIKQIATRLQINSNTAYSMLRAVRRAGGIEAYMKAVGNK